MSQIILHYPLLLLAFLSFGLLQKETIAQGKEVILHKEVIRLPIANSGDSLKIKTRLFEGFAYKFPIELFTNSNDVSFTNLSSDVICNCVQLRFSDTTLSTSKPAAGALILKPKSGQMAESIKIKGANTLHELDGVQAIAQLMIEAEVLKPINLSNAFIGVIDGKLQTKRIAVTPASGVQIKSVKSSFDPSKDCCFCQ